MDDTLLKFFIAVTAIAVAVQAGILVALYLAVRKSTARMEALATEVKSKVLPTVETAQSIMEELRPKIEIMSTNFAETSDVVNKTVISPLRQVNGLMAAISTGVDVFLGQKRRHPRNGGGVPQDEMFI